MKLSHHNISHRAHILSMVTNQSALSYLYS
nr:MAG TPA: hypothetical protein [Caudoviricetes sp.]